MNFLKSVIIMMSLYTRIPMPAIEWDKNNTKYVLTVLPLSGLLIGAAEAAWVTVSLIARIHAPLYAAAACAIPALINGGIHLDGLADTEDARASHASMERKREILKDPRTGAFGAAAIVLYELILFGIFSEIYRSVSLHNTGTVPVLIVLAFTVPRMLVQIAAAAIPPSVPEGMLYSLTSVSDGRMNIVAAVELLAVCTAALYLLQSLWVFAYIAAALAVSVYFWSFSMRQFGGISGDLCGWLMKISEAAMLLSMIITLRWM